MDQAAIAGHLETIVIFEWFSLVTFFVFIGVMGFLGFGIWKNLQSFRGRRIRPLFATGKGLARTSAAAGLSLAGRGKRIYQTATRTAEMVSTRARTTANIVRGAVPEAQKVSVGIAVAAKDSHRAATKAGQDVERSQVFRAVRSAMSIAASARTVARAVKMGLSTIQR